MSRVIRHARLVGPAVRVRCASIAGGRSWDHTAASALEGLERARADAREEGLRDGTAAAEVRLREAIDACARIAGALARERVALAARYEGRMVDLALAISEAVVRDRSERDEEMASRLARHLLSGITPDGPLAVHVHPEEIDGVRARLAAELKDLGGLLELRADPDVERGGAQVWSEGLGWDARPSTALPWLRERIELWRQEWDVDRAA